jgi:prepilin-type N-terminal cleavage/methylation domain-containing protein
MRIQNKQNGFTLLEMLVSLAIFTVVAVFAVGALVRITGLNRRAQTLQSSMTNMSFALESMSREMRVGSNFNCGDTNSWSQNGSSALNNNLTSSAGGSPCLITSTPSQVNARIIAFQSANVVNCSGTPYRLVYAYAFKPISANVWQLQKAQQTACNQNLAYPGDFSSILDDTNMTLNGYELGAFGGPGSYSWIFIRLKGYAGVRVQDQNYFDVQTSISQRISD